MAIPRECENDWRTFPLPSLSSLQVGIAGLRLGQGFPRHQDHQELHCAAMSHDLCPQLPTAPMGSQGPVGPAKGSAGGLC